jgi:small subunit ribosomal protein S17
VAGVRKIRQGVVISDKMDKTVVVLVEQLIQHPVYKKYVRSRKKYKAHDPENRCHTGDRVSIVETKPLSREKRWIVQNIVKPATAE